jgi:hypothetical protein
MNPAGTGLRRDLDRDGAHALRQDRGHVAGARAFDQLGLADRLAGGERCARDRAGEHVDGVGPLALANEVGAGRGRRPGLPAQFLRRYLVAQADVGGGDQDIGGLELSDGRRGRRRRLRPTGQECGDATGHNGDGKHDDTGGFHTLTSHNHAATSGGRNCHDAPTKYVVRAG